MARQFNITPRKKRLSGRRKDGKRSFVAPSIKPSKSVEVAYRKDMNVLINEMKKDVLAMLLPFRAQSPKAPNIMGDAGFAVELSRKFKSVQAKYVNITPLATAMATKMVAGETRSNSNRFNKTVEKATGINLNQVLKQEDLSETVDTMVEWNVDLIQSLPDEYFKQIKSEVFLGMSQDPSIEGLEQRLTGIFKKVNDVTRKTRNRAKVIARDQVSKTNASITQARQEALGVEEYVWQTAGDGNRVRATHRANSGKTFRWDKPSKITGHPGHDIQCRCTARAVITF